MASRHPYRKNCRTCERERADDERFSWSGQCQTCAEARLAENIRGIASRSGPAFKRWRVAVAASVGGKLLDDEADAD